MKIHVFITFLYKLFQDTQTALVKKNSPLQNDSS